VSDETAIPGNADLAPSDRHRRRVAIHEPYHLRVRDELDRRRASGARPVLFALHSFVPAMGGRPRPWHVGVLHDAGDTRLSRAMLARLRREEGLTVGNNEPYRMDETDYTVGRHANPNDLPYLELEVRQDLLFDDEAAGRWADRCARWLEDAMALVRGAPVFVPPVAH
jgi:predicted N-formylglutamate amidohydrolase